MRDVALLTGSYKQQHQLEIGREANFESALVLEELRHNRSIRERGAGLRSGTERTGGLPHRQRVCAGGYLAEVWL